MAIEDSNDGVYRRGYIKKTNPIGAPSSRDFKPRSEKDDCKLSVDLKSLTSAQASVIDPAKYNLFELAVADVINVTNEQGVNLIIEENPITENIAHCLISRIESDDDVTPLKLAAIATKVIL